MIDGFDYKEPACPLCGGKEFYNPELSPAAGRIPVKRIMEKTDGFYKKNDLAGAAAHLEYWLEEARALNDKNGELSVINELLGVYRKTANTEKGTDAAENALSLIEELDLSGSVSAATIILNVATLFKAFGKADKAVPLYEKVQKIYDGNLKPNDPLKAGLYNNFALALADVGETEKAEKLYLSAIEIMENAENGKIDAAISYINLAHLYDAQKTPKDKITDCLFKAYNLLCDEKNPQDSYLAFVYSKCYPSFGYFGYAKIAEELKNLSEKLYERS